MNKSAGAEAQYKKMTETPVFSLVLRLGLPTTISMLVTSIYNLADTYFVSSIDNSASGAVSVVFALMAIIQAFGFMFGHGAGSNISRRLGDRDVEGAREFSATSFYLGLAVGLLIGIFGLLFQTPFMYLLGSTDTILPYACDYSRYILIAAPAMVVSCVMNNILRYEGKATFSMIGLVSGGVLNIVLDFLFIRVIGMGVSGAGIATGISQYVSAIILVIPFLRGQVQSKLNAKYFTRRIAVAGSIIAVGMPSLMRQGLNSISTMLLNRAAGVYGDAAVAAVGIVAKVVGMMFCIGLGIGQGFQPVSAFNYGARKYSRVRKAFWFTMVFATGLLGIIGLVGQLFPGEIIAAFRDDPDVLRVGITTLRLQSLSLLVMPLTVCGNMLFQSVGKSGRATFLAATRSGLFFIPTLLILSNVFGLIGVQASQAIADVISSIVTLPLVLQFLRSLPNDGEAAENR